jgi:hypothetical protein
MRPDNTGLATVQIANMLFDVKRGQHLVEVTPSDPMLPYVLSRSHQGDLDREPRHPA